MTHYKLYNFCNEADLQPCFRSRQKMAFPADGVRRLMYTAVTPRPTACLTPAAGMGNSRVTTCCCYKGRSCVFHAAIRLPRRSWASEEPVWFVRDHPLAGKLLFQVSLVVVLNISVMSQYFPLSTFHAHKHDRQSQRPAATWYERKSGQPSQEAIGAIAQQPRRGPLPVQLYVVREAETTSRAQRWTPSSRQLWPCGKGCVYQPAQSRAEVSTSTDKSIRERSDLNQNDMNCWL